MAPQADRLALDFEIPPVFQRARAQLAELGDGALTRVRRCGGHTVARLVELRDQRLEGPADTQQRGGAFLVQLAQQRIVLACLRVHGPFSRMVTRRESVASAATRLPP